MDAAGAKELRKRLEEQAHWAQAEAVGDGRLPPTDPDARELAGIGPGIRYYACDEELVTVDGRPELVTVRIVKRLVDGEWRRSTIEERTEQAS
jgi:hypothetical protein